ncbi:MAG: hypothetical protein KDE55_04610 [Novosphingobium sp.]|nr:hypothetical protein [Novosphingobium sp.]
MTRLPAQIVLTWALPFINRYVTPGQPTPDADHESRVFAELGKKLKRYAPPNNEIINFLDAAEKMEVPVHRVAGNTWCYGTGEHHRLLDSTVTDATSEIGCRISRNKVRTADILRLGGLPAPRHILVSSADDAVTAANRLGYPVVVKPIDMSQGDGVYANLKDEKSVRLSFIEASAVSTKLIVEKHFHGKDYRLTVLNGKVYKIEGRIAAGVTGDGVSTVAQLITQLQATPHFKKIYREKGRHVLTLDGEALGLLAEEGLKGDSVLAKGRYVQLRRKNNISVGARQIMIPPESVPPENLALAVRSAELLGLDFAGVDLIIPDIATPWTQSGALICEINASPQIGRATTPTIHQEMLRSIIGNEARIPLHLLVVGEACDSVNRDAFTLANELGCNAVSTADGVWIDGGRLVGQPSGGFASARILLRERRARSALCVMSAAELAEKGLPIDRFDTIRSLPGVAWPDGLADAVRPNTTRLETASADA